MGGRRWGAWDQLLLAQHILVRRVGRVALPHLVAVLRVVAVDDDVLLGLVAEDAARAPRRLAKVRAARGAVHARAHVADFVGARVLQAVREALLLVVVAHGRLAELRRAILLGRSRQHCAFSVLVVDGDDWVLEMVGHWAHLIGLGAHVSEDHLASLGEVAAE